MPDPLMLRGIGVRRGPRTVLSNCDLTLEAGSLTHLSGANGSGKTTLLRVAAGLLRPQHGTVVRPSGGAAYVPDLGASTSRVPVAALTGAYLAGAAPAARERLPGLLTAMRYDGPHRPLPGQLSRGNRQKLLVAVALVSERQLVLADEPLAGVDTASGPVMIQMLADAARAGRTVLMTGHSDGEIPAGALRLRLTNGHCDNHVLPAAARPAPGAVITARPADGSLPTEPWEDAVGGFRADPDGTVWRITTDDAHRALRRLLDLDLFIETLSSAIADRGGQR